MNKKITELIMTEENAIRHYGRVVHYDSRPKEHYGFIEHLGSSGSDMNYLEDRIYFHASRVRRQTCAVPRPLVKFCDGDIVEYCLEVNEKNGKTSYRAYDITGLNEGYLPFHKGVVTFTPYHVALRKLARQSVDSGQAHFESVHTTKVEKKEEERVAEIADEEE
jgi:hypothetical protein